MALPVWTILVATFALIWFITRKRAKKSDLGNLKEIPGPRSLPIVGNMLEMTKHPNRQYSKWTKEFGDIYKIKLANETIVVISDPKLTKEIFSSEPAFTGRLQVPVFQLYEEHPGIGIITSEGDRWEVHRRFLLRQLRDFGFGKSSMQALITEELSEMIERLKKRAGTPVGELRKTLRLAIVNSLWSILISKRFDQDDPELLKLSMNTSEVLNEAFGGSAVLLTMPWLKDWLPGLTGYTTLRGLLDQQRDFFEEALAEKKKTFREGDENDFVDVFLNEVKKNENDPQSQFHGKLAEKQLIQTLFEMFIAGSDTTATTTSWAVLYLCMFPKAQKKLQAEISEITGDSRKVSVDDRPNMPFALALIEEVLRFSSHVPDGVPHRALADREFHGYLIKKGYFIQPNAYHIHHNPRLWGDPQNFRPERFLSADGKKFMRNENVQGFQIGRRQCVGETLARDTLFLYVTNLFQQFEMKFNPNEPEPGLDTVDGASRAPHPYSVIMTNRLK